MFWQYSEYALDSEYTTVVILLGSQKVVNKIFHHKYLRGSEYASNSENIGVTQDSVENSPSYMFDRFLSIPWTLNLPGLEYTRVVNMPRLHMFPCKMYFTFYWFSVFWMSWVLKMLRFWMYQKPKYVILKGSE